MLELQNINSGYKECSILWDVSLHVSQGEFVALIGSNGAGKTTTLLTVAGLISLTQGKILFLGQTLTRLPTHEITRLGISFVPEDGSLFLEMSIQENLFLGAYSIKSKEILLNNYDFIYSFFPKLKERRKQLAGTLSGGERKMLAIARGLMANPKILLVDEPSLGLAPNTAALVFNTLKELNKQGMTILLVEQNTNTTLQITDRAYVLEHGRVVLEGPSEELLKNEYVQKSYLGI